MIQFVYSIVLVFFYLFLSDGERILVHQLPDPLLEDLDHFCQYEDVCVIQVLDDEFLPQGRGLVQVQQELLHGRIAVFHSEAQGESVYHKDN